MVIKNSLPSSKQQALIKNLTDFKSARFELNCDVNFFIEQQPFADQHSSHKPQYQNL